MVEKRVADTILQKPLEVVIGGAKYKVAPPKNATIIRMSEMVVNLPLMTKKGNVFEEVMTKGRNSKIIGDIIALLVCGEIAPLRVYSLGSIFSHFKRGRRFRKVRRSVLYKTSPRETIVLLSQIIKMQEVGDFFTLIISLNNANTLKPTKEMIAFGQQSEQQQPL